MGVLMLGRRRLFQFCCLCCCVLPSLLSLSFIWLITGPKPRQPCSDQLSTQLIDALCEDYHSGLIVGDLCPLICTFHNLTYHRCMNHFGGKDVFVMNYGATEGAIMKFQQTAVQNPYQSQEETEENSNQKIPSLNVFKQRVEQTVADNFILPAGVSTEVIFSKMLPPGFDQYFDEKIAIDTSLRRAAMNSLWDLVQQVEYVAFKYLDNLKHITHVKGTCGKFYTVERSDPEPFMATGHVYFKFWKSDWEQRARWALALLDLIEESDNAGEYGIVHHCDLADDNFGVGPDGLVRAIDVDAVFTDVTLKQRLAENSHSRPCVRHFDCNIGDCHGSCDIKTHNCTNVRLNNNMQKLCEEILLTTAASDYAGLLRYPPPPVADELFQLLNTCAYPPPPPGLVLHGCQITSSSARVQCADSKDNDVKFQADPASLNNIRQLLVESLNHGLD